MSTGFTQEQILGMSALAPSDSRSFDERGLQQASLKPRRPEKRDIIQSLPASTPSYIIDCILQGASDECEFNNSPGGHRHNMLMARLSRKGARS